MNSDLYKVSNASTSTPLQKVLRTTHPGLWNDALWGDFQSFYSTPQTNGNNSNENLRDAALRFHHENLENSSSSDSGSRKAT